MEMTSERRQEMIRLRIEEKLSLIEIGRWYGISRQRVHKIIGNTGHVLPHPIFDPDKFWARVNVRGADECWVWAGFKNSVTGYGQLRIGGKSAYAHRVAFELAKGPIPDGLWALHKCDNPPCCNPGHLFAGTPQDNVLDALSKGRWGSQIGPHQHRAIRSSTGYKGVSAHHGAFTAQAAGKYVGRFKTAIEAALAYDEAARKVYGESALTNFPKLE